jgi:hypothetical protein
MERIKGEARETRRKSYVKEMERKKQRGRICEKKIKKRKKTGTEFTILYLTFVPYILIVYLTLTLTFTLLYLTHLVLESAIPSKFSYSLFLGPDRKHSKYQMI